MKKLLLLLCALLGLGVSGAWAGVTVTLVDGGNTNQPYNYYGSRNNGVTPNTFTTNANSGLAGLVLTAPIIDRAQWWSTQCLAIKTSAVQTDEYMTLTAPDGYLITGLSMTAQSCAGARPYKITVGDDTVESLSSTTAHTFTQSGLSHRSVSITIQQTSTTAEFFGIKAFTVTLVPINFVSLTFDRSGSGASDVTVNVKNEDGATIQGVTATLESTSITEYKTSSAAALSRTTNSVLAPNAGYDNQQNSAITYTFKVEGLAGVTFNKAALDVYAMTGGGAAQGNTGNTVRKWTFDVATGSTADGLTSFVNQEDNDICTVSNEDGGLYHNLWTMSGSNMTATNTLYVKVTLTKTDAQGCFAGLGEVRLFKPAATVQYVISDETGTVFTSDVSDTRAGETITSLPTSLQRSYCSYSTINQTMVEGENTVNVTVTYDLPFDISADYESAKWYYLNMKSGYYPTYSSEGTPNVTLPNSRTLGDENALWAFIGNPYQGFSIVNKAAGSALVLGSASPSGDGNTGANTHATLGSGQAYERYFPVSSTYRTNGFFLQTSEGYALNQRSTANLAYWTGGKDAGSTFVVEEYVENYYSLVEAEVIPFLMDGGGAPSPTIGKPFGLSSDATSSIVTTYMTQLNSQQFTLAEYEAIVAAKNAGIIYPEAGKFYLVKNNYNGKYMRVTASGTRGTVFADLTAEEAAKDASAHFTFVENDSHLYMSTQGEYLNWVYGNGNGYEGFTSTNFDKYVHFAVPAPGVGAFSIALGNGVGDYAGYLNGGFYALKNTETKVVAGSPTDQTHEMAQWTFEEVSTLGITLNGPIDGNYYATLCVPFDITALDGATAYTLAKDGTTLNTTEISPIPAGTPVLLEGTTASANATIDAAASTTISTSTALTGQYFASTFDGATNYTLGTDGTKLGFYHWDGTTLGANRAYVDGTGDSNVKGFTINWGDVDGIQFVEDGQTMDNATIYNLAGQRMNKVQRGVNIVNGKKVIIR